MSFLGVPLPAGLHNKQKAPNKGVPPKETFGLCDFGTTLLGAFSRASETVLSPRPLRSLPALASPSESSSGGACVITTGNPPEKPLGLDAKLLQNELVALGIDLITHPIWFGFNCLACI